MNHEKRNDALRGQHSTNDDLFYNNDFRNIYAWNAFSYVSCARDSEVYIPRNYTTCGLRIAQDIPAMMLVGCRIQFNAKNLHTSMRPSIRFLILSGSGRKRLDSWRVTSLTRS